MNLENGIFSFLYYFEYFVDTECTTSVKKFARDDALRTNWLYLICAE